MNATTLLLLLLVLACPLSMLFMHRGGGHSHGSRDGGSRSSLDDRQRESHGTLAVPPGEPSGDAVPVSEEGRHAHGGCGHGAGTRHEHPKSGAAA